MTVKSNEVVEELKLLTRRLPVNIYATCQSNPLAFPTSHRRTHRHTCPDLKKIFSRERPDPPLQMPPSAPLPIHLSLWMCCITALVAELQPGLATQFASLLITAPERTAVLRHAWSYVPWHSAPTLHAGTSVVSSLHIQPWLSNTTFANTHVEREKGRRARFALCEVVLCDTAQCLLSCFGSSP